MKIIFLFLFLNLTFECSSQSEFIRADFYADGGRYFITPNYVHLPHILLRAKMKYKKIKYGSITDFYWEVRSSGFEFYIKGPLLYFSKYDIKTKEEMWSVPVEICKATIYTEK